MFSWILVFPVLVVVSPSSVASQQTSASILYTSNVVVNIDLEPNIKTVAVINGTFLVRAFNSSKASEGDYYTGFYTAFQNFDIIINDGQSNSINAIKCASYKTLVEQLKIPFSTYYENGLLKYIEISKDEPALSANIKLLASYTFNINTDITFIQTRNLLEVSGISDEFIEYGDTEAVYNVKKSTVSDGTDILVQKHMDSSSSKAFEVKETRSRDCTSTSNNEFSWTYQDTMTIQTRNGVTIAPKTTIDQQGSYKPYTASANKVTFQKSIVTVIAAVVNSSLTSEFRTGSRKVFQIEPVNWSVPSSTSSPQIRTVTAALACSPPAMYASFGLYNLALQCGRA